MKYLIPAKTFLIGEYVALQGGPALLLTTSPCFEVSLTNTPLLKGIHEDSPAGRWWSRQHMHNHGLHWYDPYHGLGGLGASSAQFLGAFAASHYVQNHRKDGADISFPLPGGFTGKLLRELLDAYRQVSWNGLGVAPSGYDVISQSLKQCVFIWQQQGQCSTCSWPFADISFILLRTGVKVATHEHLRDLHLSVDLTDLALIARAGCEAFLSGNAEQLIDAISAYHEALLKRHWVAPSSVECIEALQQLLNPLAIKGCGALGADVLLVIVPSKDLKVSLQQLKSVNWHLIATNAELWG